MKRLLLVAAFALLPTPALADTCFEFAVTGIIQIQNTNLITADFTNCGTEGYIHIGEGYGEDSGPFLFVNFYDPGGFIGLGSVLSDTFGALEWAPNAPPGYSEVVQLTTYYHILESLCTVPDECVFLSDRLQATTEFTAVNGTVPVPEPATIILLLTGIAGVGAKKLRALQRPFPGAPSIGDLEGSGGGFG